MHDPHADSALEPGRPPVVLRFPALSRKDAATSPFMAVARQERLVGRPCRSRAPRTVPPPRVKGASGATRPACDLPALLRSPKELRVPRGPDRDRVRGGHRPARDGYRDQPRLGPARYRSRTGPRRLVGLPVMAVNDLPRAHCREIGQWLRSGCSCRSFRVRLDFCAREVRLEPDRYRFSTVKEAYGARRQGGHLFHSRGGRDVKCFNYAVL